MQSKAFDLQVLTLNCRMQKQMPALLEKKVGEHLKENGGTNQKEFAFVEISDLPLSLKIVFDEWFALK